MPQPGHVPMRLLTARALAQRVAAGDSRAFEELFRRHQNALYGYCVSILGSQEDAADALQNTMAKALHSLPGERRDLQLKPWLFRVAHNECIDLIRGRKQTEDITGHELTAGEAVETTVVNRERLRQVLDDLEHLPERQRGALVMRELNGLSFEQIGRALETTPVAAKQQVYEARCALQEQAEGHGMDCESVRQVLSERDGRVTGGRRIKAHLRSCEACSDFKAGIQTRRNDLRSLVPPIPVALAASLAGTIGGSGGGGGLSALLGIGGGGGAAAGGGAMKVVAIVAVTAGVGAGTVGVVEGTRDGNRSSGNEPAKSSEATDASTSAGSTGPVPAAVVSPGGTEGAGSGTGSGSGRERPDAGPGNGSAGGGEAPGAGSPGTPVAPVVPGTPGTPGNPGPPADAGGAGGSKGNGAIPSPGGKPAELPAASDKGQAQAAEAQSGSGGGGRPVDAGPPASAGASGKAVPANPGSSGKKDS